MLSPKGPGKFKTFTKKQIRHIIDDPFIVLKAIAQWLRLEVSVCPSLKFLQWASKQCSMQLELSDSMFTVRDFDLYFVMRECPSTEIVAKLLLFYSLIRTWIEGAHYPENKLVKNLLIKSYWKHIYLKQCQSIPRYTF